MLAAVQAAIHTGSLASVLAVVGPVASCNVSLVATSKNLQNLWLHASSDISACGPLVRGELPLSTFVPELLGW